MGATSARIIETAAFGVLNVFMPGEQVPSPDAESARGFLNRMIGNWSQQKLLIPAVAREVFPAVSGKGGPSNPYTIGIGGNLNTQRPPNQSNLVNVGIIIDNTVPLAQQVESPRAVLDDRDYQAIQIKELPNQLFTGVYYNPTFALGFGTINLWPVPNVTTTSLVLYLEKALTSFTSLDAVYYVQEGIEQALVDNLVMKIAKPWGAIIDDDMRMAATKSLGQIKRSNVKMSDMPDDFGQMQDLRYGYDIQTGNY